MERPERLLKSGMICFLLGMMLGACATPYHPPGDTQALYERLAQQQKGGLPAIGGDGEGLRVEVLSMMNRKLAKSTLGIDPRQYGLLPIFLKIGHFGGDPIKVDLVHSFIRVEKKPHWFTPAETALWRIGKDDSAAAFGLGLMFGFVGGAAGAVVGSAVGAAVDSASVKSTTVEEHYFRQRFGPTIIPPGSEGSGVVFYDVPWEEIESDEFILSMPVINLNTNETRTTEVSFQVKERPE
jgi:hypothetical protein